MLLMKTATAIDWHATLTEALEAPGALGNTYTRFYGYSFLNQIRLMMQGTYEPVATYNRWIELGPLAVLKQIARHLQAAWHLRTHRDHLGGREDASGWRNGFAFLPGRVLLQDLHVAGHVLGEGLRAADPSGRGSRPRRRCAGPRHL